MIMTDRQIWWYVYPATTCEVTSKFALKMKNINPCHAELTKMPRPLLIFSQSDYLIQVVHTNSPT